MKRDLEEFYTAADFDDTWILPADVAKEMSVKCNAILREYVKENGKRVFGHAEMVHGSSPVRSRHDTHTAILLDEKEIKGDE